MTLPIVDCQLPSARIAQVLEEISNRQLPIGNVHRFPDSPQSSGVCVFTGGDKWATIS
jgi:hypothetical protein